MTSVFVRESPVRLHSSGRLVSLVGGLVLLATPALAQTPSAPPAPPAPPAPSNGAPATAAPSEPAAPAEPPKPLSESLTGMARAEYEAARILYGDGDYAGALLKFELVYRESKDPRLLWNMAAAQKNLRKYAQVKKLLEQYLREAPNLSPEDHEQAVILLEAVKPFIGGLTVTADQPQAAVLVDGAEVGTTPLEGPLLLDMGRRHLELKKAEFVPYAADIDVQGGADQAVNVTLVPVRHEGRLFIATDDASAMISVDGHYVGTGHWDGRLPSGSHSVEVSAKGKRTSRLDAVINDDQQANFNVTLVAEESKVPAWAWIGGSAAVAAGLGVGGYFLFRNETAADARPLSGTMPPGYVRMP
ncbi:MAG TPA: PEGA domain-containing protein [Polyangiaceae bacterium]|nr:PEGA domain-containing protein [Polyangiaceae bacterium]